MGAPKGSTINSASAGALSVTTPTEREIRMTRLFDAPRRLVYDAMTKPELVKQWLFGPPGWTFAVCEIDLKVGGAFRYVWRGPTGQDMGMRGVFQEVKAPERIVQTEVFDDPWYPGEAIGTLVLTEQGDKTLLTLTMRYDSQATRDGVLKSGMEKGLGMSYDRLAKLLRTVGARTAGQKG